MTSRLDGRAFRLASTPQGEVDADTEFFFHEEDDHVWAAYRGGAIRRGFLVGSRSGERLSFRYVQISRAGEVSSGHSDDLVEDLADGRIRLHEKWVWESRPGEGRSVLEEVAATGAPELRPRSTSAKERVGVERLHELFPRWERDGFEVDTDPQRLDLDVVHSYLSSSYWASGISRDVVARSLDGSTCFGVYTEGVQIGFARVVSDRATFAWLADVFVLDAWRGRGLGIWLVECVVQHPLLQGLRRWLLATRDAHGLYAKVGFTPPPAPDRLMERFDADIYTRRS